MAEICFQMLNEKESPTPCKVRSSKAARRRRISYSGSFSKVSGIPTQTCGSTVTVEKSSGDTASGKSEAKETRVVIPKEFEFLFTPNLTSGLIVSKVYPKFGVASVCGRRRDMEDAVAIHPSFCQRKHDNRENLHYFGLYDGHGCSHVAVKCRERLHELVKEELDNKAVETMDYWEETMVRSFHRMDREVIARNENVGAANCRCELQTPDCDAVGSTAVVAVLKSDKIVVANCGDSRAVLCRNGKPIPLSTDHKPDHPAELKRIEASGGHVIYWDGPRVLGMLAMSRAIGDNYLKQYVICEPEVTITDRTADDDCLILASDGLWDVVSNGTACGVARMCLKGKSQASGGSCSPEDCVGDYSTDKACSDASMLLTKLALARRSADNVSVVVVDLRGST